MKVKIDYFRLMKNHFLLFLCLLFSLVSFGQKKYSFDYSIEYDFQYDESSKVEKKIFLTNSNDNSYFLVVTAVDSGYVNLDFYDENGIRSLSSMKNQAFQKADNITLKCEFVRHQNEKGKHNYDRYVFSVNQDTVIDNVKFKKHNLRYSSKRDSKKYDKASTNYIVEPNTDFHKSMLVFSSSFDVILRNDSMQNGIAKEIFTTNYSQNKKIFIFKLNHYSKIEKFLTIPKECCLTN